MAFTKSFFTGCLLAFDMSGRSFIGKTYSIRKPRGHRNFVENLTLIGNAITSNTLKIHHELAGVANGKQSTTN